ncbi:PKD domain-containing protein, partial [Patescibacteria group bacterium]|nr:PKD domain-containing protein [Patescibacteria group bacterium]
MNSHFKEIFFFLFLCSLLIPLLAEAIIIEPSFALPTFEELINAIVDFITWVALAIAPIAIIIAAFYFLTSGGDPEKVRKAKKIILFTVIGLIIILLARGITGLIRQILIGPPGPPPSCGNGIREAGEDCDGADLGGESCITLGFVGGVLACNPGCTFDTSGCISPPPNQPPVASFTKSAATVTVGEIVFFDASASFDPDGLIVSYDWNFGDGDTAGGVIVNHSYSASGNYTVTLTVTDDDGASNSATSIITVNPPPNDPPIADARVGDAPNPIGTSVTVIEGDTVHFDGSTFSSDPDGIINNYEWDFENDGFYDWSSAITGVTTHVYPAGAYTAQLRVTDDDGATNTDTVSITANPAPVLIASITSPSDGEIFLQGASITFTGSAAGGVPSYTYSWNSNLDGVIRNTSTFNKNNLSLGIHTITFQVTDSAPIPVTDSDAITITITNDVTPPTIQNT